MKRFIAKSCSKRILASRLIRSSEQMDHIKSAIDDPINAELVKQLDSYIGEEDQELLVEARKRRKEIIDKKKAEDNAPEDRDSENPDTSTSEIGNRPMGGAPSRTPRAAMPDEETPDLPGDFTDNPDAEEPDVDSSTTAIGTRITGSFDISSPKYAEIANEIKGYLNANSSTAGVSRIGAKENELWIYFDDSINLNNIMAAVIEYMSSPYPWLQFNRLARSDNAVVFVVDFINQFEDDAE